MEQNNQSKSTICKFFLKNKCSHGDKCKFIHDSEVCKNYFFDEVCKRGDGCKFKHQYKLTELEYTDKKDEQVYIKPSKYDKNKDRNNQRRKNSGAQESLLVCRPNGNNEGADNSQNKQLQRRPKNTQNFKPSHNLLDMNILVSSDNTESFYKTIYEVNDVVIVPNFIKELSGNANDSGNVYEQLITEIGESGISETDLWKSWHGDTHFIADDNLQWKEKVPTFSKILEKIESYFHFKIKSTRLNWYKNSSDWKPYHHDAAAIKENIAKSQNFTIGVSFGHTRSIAFEHAKTHTTISIPMTDGSAYAFSRDINVNWKHGIPQINPGMYSEKGRISIIAWGLVELD